MSPVLVQFLRRLAVVALLLAVLLLVLPRLLTEVGILGPSAEERVAEAAAAVEAARGYGASDDLPSFAAASKALEEARALLRVGRQRDARGAAARAVERAIVAQRDGLILRDAQRRRAEAIVTEADRRLNELETLYGRVSKSVDKVRLPELLSLMKSARQAGSGLILLYEQDDLARVIAGEKEAFATLDAVREKLREAAKARLD
jgi:hypothetical protein